jgi:cyclopropane fatty-acyl-phospholipid synthase-like methyltransferase
VSWESKLNPNWFETFFEGLALDMWRGAMTPEQSAREAEFLAAKLELQPGMKVLDVPCGNGRLAVALQARGFHITGVDISEGYIAEARAKAPEAEWILGDMRELPWTSEFDAAFCWGNSFAYFENAECRRFLAAVSAALKPGGRFVLESGAIAETLLPVLKPERTMKIGDIDFHSRNNYVGFDSRMDITYTFARGGRREVKHLHQWVHSAGEVRRMLQASGLEPVEAYGDVEGTPFGLGSPRLIALTQRR